ncbi:HAMP domain-containing sensor histidine kinase [soil metagenome]
MLTPTPEALTRQYIELAETTGGFIHDMKNHLGTVLLNLQLLDEDFEQPETQRERRAADRIKLMIDECQRLVHLSNDFLRFARVDDLHREPTDVTALITRMIEIIRPMANEQNVIIDWYPEAELPWAYIDPDMIEKVLLNLFINAGQAMPKGGTLTVQAKADGGMIILEIIDTGEGIPPDVLKKVFRPFFTTKPNGNGLGLATARRIVAAHGGELVLQSEPGHGTKVTMVLPTPPAIAG